MKSRCVRRGGRQVESQRVKLQQVGKSAGMHVPQLLQNCKCAKSKRSDLACVAAHYCTTLRSGLKRHCCFNPAELNVRPLGSKTDFPKM